MRRSIATRVRRTAAVLGFSFLAVAALPGAVARAGDDMATMVENAKTAADHEAIAAQYEKQAADAKKQAELHRKMEKAYATGTYAGGKVSPTPLPQHCAALAKHYDSIAQDDAALAAAHRAMAKAAK
jgi:hypothetical protein